MRKMRDIRPVVTGSAGLLGQAVARRLEGRFASTVSATREFLDLEDFWRVRAELERLQPTVVVNCATYADVDGCERDPDRAFRENRDTVVNLARACRAISSRLVHISTDYVFDGKRDAPYSEGDLCGPIQVYGESKWEGEREAMREHAHTLVIRTSFLFGPGRPTFIDRVIQSARRGEKIRAVLDWVNAPTSTEDLAVAVEGLIDRDCQGVVHFTNSGGCSKFEFARETLRRTGLDSDLVQPVRLADLGLPAARPERTVLDLSRYTSITRTVPRPWTEAMEAYLKKRVGASETG
jgi:dTDP-4-dehydrorhamnose reductase